MINPTNIRGLVLRALHADPGFSLSNVALLNMLSGYGVTMDCAALNREIDYLAGKTYVRHQVIYKDLVHVELTASGVDLMEGRIKDPGIVLGPGA